HAKAYHSLEKGRKGQEANWISRVHDPECLSCHVTGWDPQEVLRYDSGFLDAVTSKHLSAQQCENCHGPGTVHTDLEWQYQKDRQNVSLDDVNAARAAVKLNSATAEKQVCHKCHDAENSPSFNFAKYWDKVKHTGKD
ncbi:MAG TPA: multiheme c-type cytochrome, partial [Planctomycetaceae bacterium]|nr:multiheme c-type cytochrome [Planctomycetaceae bacterium]